MMKSAQFIPESYDANVLSIFILYPNNMDKLNNITQIEKQFKLQK